MKTISASKASSNLNLLIDEAVESQEPIQVAGKKANAVLISEEDWRAVQNTVYLLSIPGMSESIRKGIETPLDECSEDPGW